MAKNPPKADADQVADATQASLLAWLDKVDWLDRDGFYRAVVKLGDRDTVTLCATSRGPATKLLLFLRDHMSLAVSVGKKSDEEGIAAIVDALREDELAQAWGIIQDVFACCVVSWNVPELTEIWGLDKEPEAPNGNMDAGNRDAILDRLPLPVIIRVLLGTFRLTKNF